MYYMTLNILWKNNDMGRFLWYNNKFDEEWNELRHMV